MKILYLDESGDHDLINIDPEYPIFVLAGCVIDSEQEVEVLVSRLNKLKKEIFNNVKIVLHFAGYTRNTPGFEQMLKKEFREQFYTGLNKIIEDTNFILIACIVDKNEHIKHYKNALDPYLLSLEVVLERFIMLLKTDKKKGIVVAESRGAQLDNQLNLAFLDLKISGTRFLRPSDVADNIIDFRIKKKEENIAGLQLIDSVVSPIGRKYLGKKNYYIDYAVIKSKFRKHQCGKYKGYGLIIMPRKENGQPPHTQ